jgi:hypothetical protein
MLTGLCQLIAPRPQNRRAVKPKQSLGVECLEERAVPATTRFAVIGDYGLTGSPESNVATLVKSWNPDVILTVGDNNYETGSASTIDANIGQYYHDFISPYLGSYGAGAAANRFFPTLGRHDWGNTYPNPTGDQPYLNYFTLPGNERYYTFTVGSVQFFALDSDGNEPDGITSTSPQAQWLQSQLAASTATYKIVYLHDPPYSSASGFASTQARWPYQAWGATAVLAGHTHAYERLLEDNNFPYFVDGLGGEPEISSFDAIDPGSQVRYNADFGAMLVTAGDTQIQFQFITRTGTLIDNCTIANPNSLPTPSTPDLAAASDTGISNTDNITNLSNLTFTGTAVVGSTVTLFSDGAPVGSGVAADGTYTITTSTLSSGVHRITANATDSAGNTSPVSGALSVTIDTTAPTGTIVAVTPDPRTTGVSQITITFSEKVYGLNLAALQLTLNGGSNLLTASQTLTTTDNLTWNLGNLSSLTGAVGTYTLTLTAAGSGITDTAGNALAGNAGDTWQVTAPPPVTIIDDGTAGFSTVGSWRITTGQGYQSDFHFTDGGDGSRQASWTFSGLTPGQYQVSVTWVKNNKRATNAPYTVLDGSTVLAQVAVNQRNAPNDFSDQGVFWENLVNPATGSAIYSISGTTLVVRLTNKANGQVVADAVRIERITTLQAASRVQAKSAQATRRKPGERPFRKRGARKKDDAATLFRLRAINFATEHGRG